MIDLSSKFGRKVKQHLRQEYVVWLTTAALIYPRSHDPCGSSGMVVPSSFSASRRLTKCGTLQRIRRCHSISTPTRPAMRM